MNCSRLFALAVGLFLTLPLSGPFWPGAGSAAAQPVATHSAPAKSPATTAPAVLTKSPLVDINTASAADLAAIPQIGPARAKAIIAGRPYRAKDDLVSNRIIAQGVYEKIRDKIIAKQ